MYEEGVILQPKPALGCGMRTHMTDDVPSVTPRRLDILVEVHEPEGGPPTRSMAGM